ncbi:hypothetical protein OV203_28760 [Nannocystis sp. ILAH1]|uniref:hypothetical protein n=1 Tax=Nannocystis sp. ILAH1 TaxID=2996789 RepID=UPI00226EF3EC|nr:hypothetical protein [Nannocystis sp. ILAH1]MCY0991171.1 hypothetical protein [Nannocystis sp. ILAH1]
MIEPLDDELRRLVGALREVDRPGEAARAATWAAIDARLAEGPAPRRTAARVSWPLAALAAALLLALGLAAATAWREAERASVEAVDQHSPESTPRAVEPRPLRAAESSQPATSGKPGESPQSDSSSSPEAQLDSTHAGSPESQPDSSHAGAPESQPDSSQAGSLKSQPDASQAGSPGSSAGHQASPGTEPARPAAPSRRRPTDSPSLRPEEVASFQRAQAALAAGRYDEALDALDAHGLRFAGGLFEEERQVSRATALCKLGRVDAARDARRRFLRERPGSHLAERMRQICRDDE